MVQLTEVLFRLRSWTLRFLARAHGRLSAVLFLRAADIRVVMSTRVSVAARPLRDRALRAALQLASFARNFEVGRVAAVVLEPLALFLESAVAFFLLVDDLIAANRRVRSHEAAALLAEHARYVAHRAFRELVVVCLVAGSGAAEHDVVPVTFDRLVARIARRAKNASVVRRAEVVPDFVRESDVRNLFWARQPDLSYNLSTDL